MYVCGYVHTRMHTYILIGNFIVLSGEHANSVALGLTTLRASASKTHKTYCFIIYKVKNEGCALNSIAGMNLHKRGDSCNERSFPHAFQPLPVSFALTCPICRICANIANKAFAEKSFPQWWKLIRILLSQKLCSWASSWAIYLLICHLFLFKY